MTKKKLNRPPSVAKPSQDGQGTSLPVASSPQGREIFLDGNKFRSPDRRFCADQCSVIFQNNFFKLVFAQTKIYEEGWEQCIVINSPLTAVARFLKSLTLSRIYQEMERRGLSVIPVVEPKESQSVSLPGHMFVYTTSGEDATLEVHAFDLKRLSQVTAETKVVDEYYAYPIVTIYTTAPIITGLIEKIQEVWSSNSHLTSKFDS